MDNILKFPESRIKRTQSANTHDPAEDKRRMVQNKARFVEHLTEHYGVQLINKLAAHGFDVDNPQFLYDFIFTIEVLRSGLLRNIGVDHPLQKLSDNSEKIIGESEFNIDGLFEDE